VARERSVSVEVKRVVEPMSRAEDGELGKSHPFDLKNIAHEDPNVPVLTRIWTVGKHGTLTERTGPGRAIFRSDSTYVVLFSYKNGSAHVIHTWTGAHAPLTNRTACSLKAQTLLFDLKLDGAEYHSHLRQHAESVFFCELLKRAETSFVVLTQHEPQLHHVFKVCTTPYVDTDAVMIVEQDFKTVAQQGLYDLNSYVVIVLDENVDVAPSLYVYFGTKANRLTHDSVRTITTPSARSGDVGSVLNALLHELQPEQEARKSWKPNVIQLGPLSGTSQLARVGLLNGPISALERSKSLRLFEISYSKRQVGGMFVEEIGSSVMNGINGNVTTFRQSDLKETRAYVLDSASSSLFVWFGKNTTWEEDRMLAIEVAALYSRKSMSDRLVCLFGFLTCLLASSTIWISRRKHALKLFRLLTYMRNCATREIDPLKYKWF
jgi:hypothetical protein